MKDIRDFFLRKKATADAAPEAAVGGKKKKGSKAERVLMRADLLKPLERLAALAPPRLEAAKYVRLFVEKGALEALLGTLCVFKGAGFETVFDAKARLVPSRVWGAKLSEAPGSMEGRAGDDDASPKLARAVWLAALTALVNVTAFGRRVVGRLAARPRYPLSVVLPALSLQVRTRGGGGGCGRCV